LLLLFGNSVLACRFFSVLLSTLTLWLAVQSAGLLFRNKNLAVLVTAIGLGFHPILLRIGSAVSNDNLAWFFSALLFSV
jgi:uncharacterized membrane protein